MPFRSAIFAFFCLHQVMAQPAADSTPTKPSVTKIDEARYQVGEVLFDSKIREIRFPASVNMTEGLLEYVIVHESGKVHESLLSTKISPTHLNLAFTLLRYTPSRELCPLPNATGGTSGNFPDVPADVKSAARVIIEVEWTQDGKIRRVPINDWIQHTVKATAMPHGPWVYGGSNFHDGSYVAELSGDVAAIFLSPASILQYPGDDYADDTVWMPFPKRVPAVGTAVTVIITSQQTSKPLPSP